MSVTRTGAPVPRRASQMGDNLAPCSRSGVVGDGEMAGRTVLLRARSGIDIEVMGTWWDSSTHSTSLIDVTSLAGCAASRVVWLAANDCVETTHTEVTGRSNVVNATSESSAEVLEICNNSSVLSTSRRSIVAEGIL